MNNATGRVLVKPEWLKQNINRVRLLDVRLLTRYVSGHIPGAVHFDMDLVIRDDGHFTVADADLIHDLLEENGITPDTPVVIYDHENGFNAARLFWTLEYIGHRDVWLLDGGFHMWKFAGCSISTAVPQVERSIYPQPQLEHRRYVDGDWILKHLDSDALTLIDTRSEGEYSGKIVLSMYGGHIPGALNIEWTRNFHKGEYLPPRHLMALYANVPFHNQVVLYSQFGYRAAATYVALRILGYPSVAIYDNSWSEWGDRDDLPITTMYHDEDGAAT